MKLSQILQSQSVRPDGDQDGRDSWGIFLSPERNDHVIKLFYSEQQFNDEKTGYDKVLCEINLKRFANQYSVISLQLDAVSNNHRISPFKNALLIPYLENPPWESIGKLGTKETNDKLSRIGIKVDKINNDFLRIGVVPWETTFFIHSVSNDIRAIDFTYSQVVLNNFSDTK